MRYRRKSVSGIASMAALSMLATPLAAADLPSGTGASPMALPPASSRAWSADAEIGSYHGRHYDGYRYRHRRNRVDGGDILTGVLILGGIAAVASAVRNSERDSRYRDRDDRPDYDRPDYDRRDAYRSDDPRGLDRAASICVAAIERDARVESVDMVDRNAAGWTVRGRLFDGQGFACTLGADGRVDAVDYGTAAVPYGSAYAGPDNQWEDDRYLSARADLEARGGYAVVPDAAPLAEGPVPAYPGGPLPGEADYED